MSNKPKLPGKADIKFALSEDVRQEGAGRFSLLGVFAGERFSVGGEVPHGFGNVAFVLPSLAFLFVIRNGEGKVPASVKITAPDGSTVVGQSQANELVMQPGNPTVLANVSKPFLGPAFGTYIVQLEVGTRRFKFPVVIEKGAPKKRGKSDSRAG